MEKDIYVSLNHTQWHDLMTDNVRYLIKHSFVQNSIFIDCKVKKWWNIYSTGRLLKQLIYVTAIKRDASNIHCNLVPKTFLKVEKK